MAGARTRAVTRTLRVAMYDQHHHQRPAADAAGGRSDAAARLNGVKITLDGDRDTHNRMRPLRGGQGTFDRIVENIRAGRRPRAASPSAATSAKLGRQLSRAARVSSEQDFADKLSKVYLQADRPRRTGGRDRASSR